MSKSRHASEDDSKREQDKGSNVKVNVNVCGGNKRMTLQELESLRVLAVRSLISH